MKLKLLFTVQIFVLIFIFGSANFVKAQKTENVCGKFETAKDIPKDEIICLDSKELNKRIVFISELYAPPTANSTSIKNKTVLIDIFVNKEGKVTEAVILKGHPALSSVAVVIAYKAKFKPMKIDNELKNMCGQLILTWNPKKLDDLNAVN